MLKSDDLRLYLVTDEGPDLLPRLEAALRGGVTCVQLRLKKASFAEFVETAKACKAMCRKYQVPFVVNDRADVAKEVAADALHIGQTDLDFASARRWVGEQMPIGVSVHTLEQALQAEKDGAAYVGVGSMFPTSSKSDYQLVSLETLQRILQAVRIPVVVIGGIHQQTLPKILPYQPDGVAVISAILGAPDPEQAARELLELVQKGLSFRQ